VGKGNGLDDCLGLVLLDCVGARSRSLFRWMWWVGLSWMLVWDGEVFDGLMLEGYGYL